MKNFRGKTFVSGQMRHRSGTKFAVAGVLLAALLGVVSRLSAQEFAAPAASPEQKPKGDAEITVSLSDGKILTTCTVYARNQAFTLAAPDAVSLARG